MRNSSYAIIALALMAEAAHAAPVLQQSTRVEGGAAGTTTNGINNVAVLAPITDGYFASVSSNSVFQNFQSEAAAAIGFNTAAESIGSSLSIGGNLAATATTVINVRMDAQNAGADPFNLYATFDLANLGFVIRSQRVDFAPIYTMAFNVDFGRAVYGLSSNANGNSFTSTIPGIDPPVCADVIGIKSFERSCSSGPRQGRLLVATLQPGETYSRNILFSNMLRVVAGDGYSGRLDIAGLRFGFAAEAIAAPAVPEPATWSMMILGFGAVGAAMRSDRRKMRVTQA